MTQIADIIYQNRPGYPKLPFVAARHGRTRDPIRTYTWL